MPDNKKKNKEKVYNKVTENLPKFKNVLVCDIKDLPADVVARIRHLLRGIETECVCGKTTVIMKTIRDYLENNKGKLPSHLTEENLTQISKFLEGLQVMLIFTNRQLSDITEIINKFTIEKQAKPGQLSPIEVIIPAGPTGMDASQIEYFQALKIPTKVMRNQLEITNSTKILTVGQKISISEINLMKKFNIKPYKHLVSIKHLLLNGKLYDEGILKVTNDYMKEKLELGIKNLLSFSLGANVPTNASAPQMVANAFRNICGLSLGTGVLIPQTQNLKAEAPKKEEKKEEKKKEEKPPEPPKEDSDDADLGGLF
jgi:large subunit ribosomal protein LP0